MKKEYLKPTMEMVKLQHNHQILAGSSNAGMNNQLQEDEVNEGW